MYSLLTINWRNSIDLAVGCNNAFDVKGTRCVTRGVYYYVAPVRSRRSIEKKKLREEFYTTLFYFISAASFFLLGTFRFAVKLLSLTCALARGKVVPKIILHFNRRRGGLGDWDWMQVHDYTRAHVRYFVSKLLGGMHGIGNSIFIVNFQMPTNSTQCHGNIVG